LYTLLVALAVVSSASAKEPAGDNAEEKALRQAMQRYEDAFNRADAKQLAAEWTPSGEYLTASGERLQGRDAIQAAYTALFAEAKDSRMDASTARLGLIAPNVAVAEGTARLISADKPPVDVTYEAIFVKQDGGWKLSRVREAPVATSPSDSSHLEELAWMVGEWRSRSQKAAVRATCRWTNNNRFLVRSFRVSAEDGAEVKAVQYIGWDPSAGQVRSWSFDSEGGFEEAVWRGDAERWIVDAVAVLPDGRKGSAERIVTPVDKDTYTWRSVNRQVDGQLLPSTDTVTLVRTPAASAK
jgi:uncharacterized protein (TIGR02246 family)